VLETLFRLRSLVNCLNQWKLENESRWVRSAKTLNSALPLKSYFFLQHLIDFIKTLNISYRCNKNKKSQYKQKKNTQNTARKARILKKYPQRRLKNSPKRSYSLKTWNYYLLFLKKKMSPLSLSTYKKNSYSLKTWNYYLLFLKKKMSPLSLSTYKKNQKVMKWL
jgi:hypothetical protein